MKIFKVVVNSDNGCQAVVDSTDDKLFSKDLYKPYTGKDIPIRLDLGRRAKKTDVLLTGDLSIDGFPIADFYANLMKTYNLHQIQFANIADDVLKEYKFMFFNGDLTHQLDYVKSDFILVEDMLGDVTELDVKIAPNRNSVIQHYRDYCVRSIFNFIVPQNGYNFVSDFRLQDHDVFRIGHFDKSFYISERLKIALESNGITGMDFYEAPLFDL